MAAAFDESKVISYTFNTPQLLKVKLLNKNAKLPQRATDGSAGFDIYSAEEHKLNPGEKAIISTGISIELPPCPFPDHIYCFKIVSRSGLSAKHSVEKGAGLIDADYRGEIKVILYNLKSTEPKQEGLHIHIGDRIAQGIIIPVAMPFMRFMQYWSPLNKTLNK